MYGAILSIVTITAIIVGFSSLIISVMERTSIESTLEITKSPNPSPTRIINDGEDFMFAISIQDITLQLNNYDLGNGPQIFEFTAYQMHFKNGNMINTTFLTLEACRR